MVLDHGQLTTDVTFTLTGEMKRSVGVLTLEDYEWLWQNLNFHLLKLFLTDQYNLLLFFSAFASHSMFQISQRLS